MKAYAQKAYQCGGVWFSVCIVEDSEGGYLRHEYATGQSELNALKNLQSIVAHLYDCAITAHRVP